MKNGPGLDDLDNSDLDDVYACDLPETFNVLEEADGIVGGPRRKEYGHPKQNFSDVAKSWEAVLGCSVTPLQVIQCMIMLKVCRANQGYKRDTFVDVAGYARCAELIQE